MPHAPAILVFDSGLGGRTVFREIVKARPDAAYTHVADDVFFPYGHHTEGEIISRVVPLVGDLIRTHAPDVMVIACNTISTLVMTHLRDAYTVPFVGTVPAIKPACAASRSKRVSVLGTKGTVRREYTQALIRDFAQGCDVTLVGAADLASLAEAALNGEAISDAAIAAEIAPCFVDGVPRAPTRWCWPAPTIRCCWTASRRSRPGRWTGSIRRRRSHGAPPISLSKVSWRRQRRTGTSSSPREPRRPRRWPARWSLYFRADRFRLIRRTANFPVTTPAASLAANKQAGGQNAEDTTDRIIAGGRGEARGRRVRATGRHQAHAAAEDRIPDGYNTITATAEIQPGGSAGRHTHPGIETGYVLEGEADLIIEGKPDLHLKAGDPTRSRPAWCMTPRSMATRR